MKSIEIALDIKKRLNEPLNETKNIDPDLIRMITKDNFIFQCG